MIRFLITAILCIISAGCNNNKSAIVDNRTLAYEVISNSTNNKAELEKVILHYQNIGDSAKVQAVYYLIANMPGKKSVVPIHENPFDSLYNRLKDVTYLPHPDDPSKSFLRLIVDSVRSYASLNTVVLPDTEYITADFLIANIDNAFEQWGKAPWHDQYNFDQFCEWVLPYRNGNEKLEDWRTIALQDKIPSEDSLLAASDMVALTKQLLGHNQINFHVDYSYYPFPVSFSEMMCLGSGTCGMSGQYGTQILRARSIPVAEDVIPIWANRNSNHQWHSIIFPDGSSKDIGYNFGGVNPIGFKISKIYRKTNSIQREDILYKRKSDENIPPFFDRFNLIDVTTRYDFPVSDIEIDTDRDIDSKIMWLCTFNNFDWVPVAYTAINGKKAVFEGMGRGILWGDNDPAHNYFINEGGGIVYMPVFFIHNNMVPAADPVILYEDDSIRKIEIDPADKDVIYVKRKYPKSRDYVFNENYLIGGRFEGANKPDFSDAEPLVRIEKTHDNPMGKLSVYNDKPYNTTVQTLQGLRSASSGC